MITAIIAIIVLGVLGGIGSIAYIAVRKVKFKTANTNTVLLITGGNLKKDKGQDNIFTDNKGRRVKYVRGGGTWVWGTQSVQKVKMTSMQIQESLTRITTKQGVYANATFNAMIKISDVPEQIILYAEQSTGKDEGKVIAEVGDVLKAKVRSIMTSMDFETINGNYKEFSNKVAEEVIAPLQKMGLEVISFDLIGFNDDGGYLDALGAKQVSEVKKTSALAVAQNEKEQAIEEARILAEKEEEKQAYIKSQAQAELSTNLQLIENTKQKEEKEVEADLQVTQLRIQNDIKVQEAEKAKELALTELNLKVEAQKKETENSINLANTLKQAEIEQAKATKLLELEQTKAERQRIEKETEVYKKLKDTEMQAQQVKLEGEAKAEAIRMVQMAEAEGIKAKGEATAHSIKLKAEAEASNAELILMQGVINMLPELAKSVAEPLSRINEINLYGGGNSQEGGVTGLTTDLVGSFTQSMDMLKKTTGIDMKEVIDGYATRGNTHTVVIPEVQNKQVVTETTSKPIEEVKELETVSVVEEQDKLVDVVLEEDTK